MNKRTRQVRFLGFYREDPRVARACRLAGIPRSTLYRWQEEPIFAAQMKAAWRAWAEAHEIEQKAQELVRLARHMERNASLRPARAAALAKARAARQPKVPQDRRRRQIVTLSDRLSRLEERTTTGAAKGTRSVDRKCNT
jgi:hypothetical protein